MIDDTTIRTKAADRLTEWREANNALALAIRDFNQTHSVEDKEAVRQARKEVDELREVYREARNHLLEHVCEKQPGYKAQTSSSWLRRKLIRN